MIFRYIVQSKVVDPGGADPDLNPRSDLQEKTWSGSNRLEKTRIRMKKPHDYFENTRICPDPDPQSSL